MSRRYSACRSYLGLQKALLQLMADKPFSRITVAELAERAGVSRLTFYRNYASKEEVLTAYFDGLFDEYFQEMGNEGWPSLREALIRCFESWQAHADDTRLLIRNGLSDLIHQPFGRYLDQVLDRVRPPIALTHTQRRFVVGGLFFVLVDWLEESDGRTADDLAGQILGFLSVEDDE